VPRAFPRDPAAKRANRVSYFGQFVRLQAQTFGHLVQRLAAQASDVLNRPGDFKHLGRAGAKMIQEHGSLAVSLPRVLALYEDAVHAYREDRQVSGKSNVPGDPTAAG
jgi:hypothetical protein